MLSLCVYRSVCLQICMYVYIKRVCVCVCVCVCVRACVCIMHMQACVCVLFVCLLLMLLCVWLCVCVCACVCKRQRFRLSERGRMWQKKTVTCTSKSSWKYNDYVFVLPYKVYILRNSTKWPNNTIIYNSIIININSFFAQFISICFQNQLGYKKEKGKKEERITKSFFFKTKTKNMH